MRNAAIVRDNPGSGILAKVRENPGSGMHAIGRAITESGMLTSGRAFVGTEMLDMGIVSLYLNRIHIFPPSNVWIASEN